MSKKLSVAIATTGIKENDLPVALAVYCPETPSLSQVFTFKHEKPSHPQAFSIHKFAQADCPISLQEQALTLHDLFLGADCYCYNAFFALGKFATALYIGQKVIPALYPFPATWHCTMNMSEAHFAHERASDIEANAVAQSPKFTEILRRLKLDEKGMYQDDPHEALLHRAILNYQIADTILKRREDFLSTLTL